MLSQTIENPAIGNLGRLSPNEFLSQIISALISLGFVVGALIFMFMLLIGGIQWITSGGEKTSYEQAKSRITSALIGLVVLFSFFAILYFVECFFGIGIREISIGELNISFSGAPFCRNP